MSGGSASRGGTSRERTISVNNCRAGSGDGRPVQAPPPAERAAARLVTPERLAEFFAPRSVAVVGASDTSGWARFVAAATAASGFGGPLIPVHPEHETVFGRKAVRSLRELDEPVDLAFIMTPPQAVEAVLDDAASAGVRGAVVLAAGYREAGDAGHAAERRLAARAAAHGITLLGPNCLGFVNAHARAAPFALTIPQPLLAGPVGIGLQSGALASVVLAFARARAIGVSTLATLGNEAMIGTTDMIEYLVRDERTRAICLFLEEIADPAAFSAAAQRANAAGKPIIALKVGSSPEGQQAALAHTGSVAGDDAVVDAVFRQLNVIRVTSIEELLTTAELLACNRWPRGRRMGVLTASGGACDIIADRASVQGIVIPTFAPATAERIAAHLPPFAAVRNPLDVTGYFLANPRASALTTIDHALDAAVEDPGLDFVLFAGLTLPESRPNSATLAAQIDERIAWLGQRIAAAPIPVIGLGMTCVDVTPYARQLFNAQKISVLGGMELGIKALGYALTWLERREAAAGLAGTLARPRPGQRTGRRLPAGPWLETAARELLASHGVPMVPAELAESADAAVAAASRLGLPAALKICSAQLTHKSDVGGVLLGLASQQQVRDGYERVLAAGRAVPGAHIDGVLVSPMRTGGVELLAGVRLDPAFGPVLAVGLGGIWVEVLGDTSLRLLPVEPAEVLRMLGELRGAPLLAGARGTRPADMGALAEVISNVGSAALALGGALSELEVNPLWVDGDRIEALDVLVVTGDEAGSRTEHAR